MNLTVEKYCWAPERTCSYLITCTRFNRCAVIDPPPQNTDAWLAIDQKITNQGWCLSWILHTTLDNAQLSGAEALKRKHICAQSALGRADSGDSIYADQFDRLLADGDCVQVGHIVGHVVNRPDHTTPFTQYQFDQYQFVGNQDASAPTHCQGEPIYLARTA